MPEGYSMVKGPLCDDGPIWRIELAGPVWPKSETGEKR